MSGIAFKFGVSLDELLTVNPDVSPNSMSIGTKLNIPSNPANPTGASTSTPVPAPVKQIECYPTTDQGMWCFVLVHNDTPDVIENLSAQVTLLDADGRNSGQRPGAFAVEHPAAEAFPAVDGLLSAGIPPTPAPRSNC